MMNLKFNKNKNITYIIGNINDKPKIIQTLIRHNFDIIILAAALKHIEKCEYETNECINTNLLGTKTVLDSIEENQYILTNLKQVCFVSTDKACSPVNIYGMSKAISEGLMVEKSRYINNIKFVCVRYGNVLNSRGSIIPILHNIGRNPEIEHYTLTHPDMTRFVMTLEQSVDLIDHAILNADSGDIVIPKLTSCRVKDLIEIFSELYNKPIKTGSLRPGEKLLESLINETQSLRIISNKDGYTYIQPNYKEIPVQDTSVDYNSKLYPLTKNELFLFLSKLKLLSKTHEDTL